MWSLALPRRAPRCTDCRTSTVIAVAAVIGQSVNQHPTVTDRTIRREVVRGHEPSLGLDNCEGSTGLAGEIRRCRQLARNGCAGLSPNISVVGGQSAVPVVVPDLLSLTHLRHPAERSSTQVAKVADALQAHDV